MRPSAVLRGTWDDLSFDVEEATEPAYFEEPGSDLDEAPITQRETIPVPRESGVRLAVARVTPLGATVDVVVCDLTRDPRSESFAPRPSLRLVTKP